MELHEGGLHKNYFRTNYFRTNYFRTNYLRTGYFRTNYFTTNCFERSCLKGPCATRLAPPVQSRGWTDEISDGPADPSAEHQRSAVAIASSMNLHEPFTPFMRRALKKG